MKGRPYEFPDPNDVTPNNPGTIVSSGQVVGLYNQSHAESESMKNVTEKVRAWFTEEAKRVGWDEARFINSQCTLSRTDLPLK